MFTPSLLFISSIPLPFRPSPSYCLSKRPAYRVPIRSCAHHGDTGASVHSSAGEHSNQSTSSSADLATDSSIESSSLSPDISTSDPDSPEESSVSVAQGPAQVPEELSASNLPPHEAALMKACYDADVPEIDRLLEKKEVDPNIKDLNSRTLLHFVASNGLKGLTKKLITMGADLNAMDILGYTPLHMASGYGKVETVKVLVEEGADCNIASLNGELPVEIAERMWENCPEKKWFRRNEMWSRWKDLVEFLDEATEVEDDDEDDQEEGEGTQQEMERTEETENAKFVIRVKSKEEQQNNQKEIDNIIPDDVKVTVRIKKPE